MRFARPKLWLSALIAPFWLATLNPIPLQAGGVTIITHGLNGTTTGWVRGMADAISARAGGDVPLYRLQVTESGGQLTLSLSKLAGSSPLSTSHGEIVVMLDWGPVSNGNSYDTYQVAAAVEPALRNTSFVPDLGGHALAEFPLHLIGHSRGGSLICELSRLLGTHGVWVDQITALDAHPLNDPDFFWDFIYSDTDAPVQSYQNVLWSESYYQDANTFVYGKLVPGSAWRKQTTFDGGYGAQHSDIHLWYHGTVNLETPAWDGDYEGSDPVMLTDSMRDAWWTSVEERGTNTGFLYTLLGGGDRLSTDQPNGSDSTEIREGYNRYYDVGDGTNANNRSFVGSNSGEWPNPILFSLLTTNVVEQGDTAELDTYFQWAQPTNSFQSVAVLADVDSNPLNGNEVLLTNGFASGTAAEVGHGTNHLTFNGSIIAPGQYHLCIEMSAAGRTRFLYAPQTITLTASTQPLWLDITGPTNSTVTLGINGFAGQTAVLEMSMDGLPWMPMATNTLGSSRWEVVEPIEPTATLTLFRALLVSP